MLLHFDSGYACTLTLGRQPKCNAKEAISSLNFLCFHLNTFSHSMHYPTANSFHCVCSFFLFTLFNTENLSKLQEGICIASPSMQGWMSWEGEVCFTCSLRTFNTESHREPKKDPYKGIITRPEQNRVPRELWAVPGCPGADFRATQGSELTNTFCTGA